MKKPERITILLAGGQNMNIAAYLRVSTDSQSVAHQQNAVEEWAKARGYKTSELIYFKDEGISGALPKSKRAGFNALLTGVMAGKVKRVLVFETSRLSRDFLTYLEFLSTCQKQGCSVEVIGKGEQAFSTSQDMLMASIHAFLGQAEREKISERTKSGLAAAKARAMAEGRALKLGAPKGHSRNLGWQKEHDPALVRQVLNLEKKGLSCRQIALVMNDAAGTSVISAPKVGRLVKRYKATSTSK